MLHTQVVLTDEGERFRETVQSSGEIESLAKAATNAFALYKRTREGASPESIARASSLPWPGGPHPTLATCVPSHAPAGLEAQVWSTANLHSQGMPQLRCMLQKNPPGI